MVMSPDKEAIGLLLMEKMMIQRLPMINNMGVTGYPKVL
jgi:hypothetical protein